jgi:hypothetical protein
MPSSLDQGIIAEAAHLFTLGYTLACMYLHYVMHNGLGLGQ